MIIRKPYAFLIKHFRLIHGIIFAMLVFLMVRSLGIYSFFSDYASKHYFVNTVNLVSDHISPLMYIVCVLTLVFCVVIYYLFSEKKKNRGIYLFIIIYSVVLIGYYIYISSVLNGLISKSLNVETVRAIRDISLIIVLPQFIFIPVIIARALGFNLKQFEFKRDLEDLQIETTDNEEVEVTLGKNNYKYKRFFAKCYRLLGYYIEENKFFVTGLLSVIMLAISITIYLNIKVYNVKYNTNQEIFTNTMYYKVNESYLTNKEASGMIIDETKYYLIVNVNIKNKSSTKYYASTELFRLDDGENNLTPKFNMSKLFADFGDIFVPKDIAANSEESFNVVFEIDKKKVKDEYLFRINNLENLKTTSKNLQYSDIIINPINIDDVTEGTNYVMKQNIDFSNTLLKNSSLSINKYEISDSFKDSYNYCLNKTCYDKTYIISPSNTEKNTIIKIQGTYKIDDSIYLKDYLKNFGSIFEYFGVIKYRYMGDIYTEKLNKLNVSYEKDGIAYYEVSNKVDNADKVEINLTIRGKIITINLK